MLSKIIIPWRESTNVVGLRNIELMDVTASLRVCIFNYLGETQEELVNLRSISKQLYEDCKRPGIEWKIFISMIEISPIHGGGSMEGLVLECWRHLMDNSTDKKLRRCFRMTVRMTVVDAYKFYSNPMTLHEVKGMIKIPRMDWI